MLNRPNVSALAAWSAVGSSREDVPHKSIVEWPEEVRLGTWDNTSEDTHRSAGAAIAVCRGGYARRSRRNGTDFSNISTG